MMPIPFFRDGLRPLLCIALITAIASFVSAQTPAPPVAPPPLIPETSAIATADPSLQRLLLNPLEEGGVVHLSQWNLQSPQAIPYAGLPPKVGASALEFKAEGRNGGGKGDFTLVDYPGGQLRHLGLWVYLKAGGNVNRYGFQVVDNEGESLAFIVAAEGEGWKWLEADLQDPKFEQAYEQKEKNKKVDLPLKNIGFVWFSQESGPTSLGVDALIATALLADSDKSHPLQAILPASGEPNRPFSGQILVHNYSAQAAETTIAWSIQRNPTLYDQPLPDPILGSDLAEGKKSWVEVDGEKIEDGSLTDGDDDSGYSTNWREPHFTEIFQFVDLGSARSIKAMAFRSGDANWVFKADWAASADGVTYQPIEGLQNFDLHGKWGRQNVPVTKPFSARFLRLRYHHDGAKESVMRTPAALLVYDGVADEKLDIPKVGEIVEQKTVKIKVPAKSFACTPLTTTAPLGSGSYLLGLKTSEKDDTRLSLSSYFVKSALPLKLQPSSRFGMNTAVPDHIPELAYLGMGWVRFENMKWMFYNPAPDDFRFDGTVQPWVVPFDDYMEKFHQAGISILPYIFMTPEYATSAGPEIKKNRNAYKPKDNADYGKAIFETVARYSSVKYPPEKLKTKDGKSGLNFINTYELWNEPNLNDPGWGPFVDTLPAYFEVFRAGAEGAKRADPKAQVTNGGWAGLSMDWIDQMRTYRYADGKNPLDFTDILNVHFYSGKQEPELCTSDPNVYRNSAKTDQVQTYEKDLIDLADWRDDVKPGMKIWLTETGNDVGGPMGRTERYQAAKIPRCFMIALANNVEKVFLYRDTGSTPAQHAGSGLIRNDGSLRPSLFSLATMIRQLDGVPDGRVPRLVSADPRLWMYRWKKGADSVVTVWTPEGTIPLGLDLGKCQITDSFGAVKEMDVTKTFEVGIFPVYLTKIGTPAPLDVLEREAIAREAQRQKDRAFRLKTKAYLFQFGSKDPIATKIIGQPRPFVPVLADTLHDTAKGYGFVGEVGGKNSFRHWYPETVDKGSILFWKATPFRVDAEPGIYELAMKVERANKDSQVVLSGDPAGDRTLVFDAKTNQATAKITVVKDQPLIFTIPGDNTNAVWLTMIKTAETK